MECPITAVRPDGYGKKAERETSEVKPMVLLGEDCFGIACQKIAGDRLGERRSHGEDGFC